MRPYALVESSPESLRPMKSVGGTLKQIGDNGYVEKSFDLLMSLRMSSAKNQRIAGQFRVR